MMSENGDMVPDETRSFKNLSPGTMISHYRVEEMIGAGGMGVVYRAVDTRLKRTVALKFLPPHLLCDAEAKTRFEHEAQAASALSHPNITTIYEIDEDDGRCFIAMEYVDGSSIKEMLKEKNLFLDEGLDLAIQIGEGLAAAHKKDVVHRDVKSDNIMVAGDGRVKIMDFGLAKLRGATRLTKTSTTVGTLQYMSPEQAQGKDTDQRSDIFSFGVVLYEMITGRLPFKGENEAAVIHSVLSDTPEPLARYKADVPEALQRVVEKALYKNKEERYQHVDDMVADLKREKHVSERVETVQIPAATTAEPGRKPPGRSALKFIIPVALVALAILLIFVFEPFRIEMGPDQVAEAQENSLAIMYFENVVDPEDSDKTARMITSLLITDLSESQYMYVISRQRLYDILSSLGKEDIRGIDKDVASEVAERAEVRFVLTGEILQVEPNLVVTSDISDAGTGRIIATQRVAGEEGEDIFDVVDRLSRAVKADMDLPEEARSEPSVAVNIATTESPEAFRYFTEGVDYTLKAYWYEAEQSYRKALEIDSTFAMAYWGLFLVVGEPESGRLIARALEYADSASPREKLFITAVHTGYAGDAERAVELLKKYIERYPGSDSPHYIIAQIYRDELDDLETSIVWLRELIEVNPYFKPAYNFLAYAYEDIGDLHNAVWAINEYIALAPDEANPYDSRADLYAYNGKIDEAIESYKMANTRKPGFASRKLGVMYLFKGEYARAEAYFREVAASEDREMRSFGRYLLAVLPLYQGKIEDGIRAAEDGIAADRMEQITPYYGHEKYRLLATAHLAKGNEEAALEWARKGMELRPETDPDQAYYMLTYLYVLVETGRLDEAEEVAAALERELEERPDAAANWSHWFATALIERGRGNLDGAISNVEKSIENAPSPPFHLYAFLAEYCIEAGRAGEAVEALEYALGRYDEFRLLLPLLAVRSYYSLGIAYEMSGWNLKAIEQYEIFLDLCKDADPGIPAVDDARERLERLRAAS